jgi:hypothetical protein
MRKNHRRILFSVLVTVVTAISMFSFAADRRKKRATVASPSATAVDTSNVEGLVFSIQPFGIEPGEVNVAQRSYLLIVQNRSGIRDLTFRVETEAGSKLYEIRNQKLQWKKIFDLNPGRYVLTVVEHPEWRTVITVRPHAQ